jgi:serine protease Do
MRRGRLFLSVAVLVGSALASGHRPLLAQDKFSDAFIKAAERVQPSVVAIVVTREASPEGLEYRFLLPAPEGTPAPELPEDMRQFFRYRFFGPAPEGAPLPESPEEWRQFFRQQQIEPPSDSGQAQPVQPRRQRQRVPRAVPQQGLGSGVIYSATGYILTNNHVVGGARKMEVVFPDGDSTEAQLVGADPKSDLAVVKVETSRALTPARFGNSDKLRVGQWVLAVGSPFGLTESVSAGIISGLGRDIGAIRQPFAYENFIQTDANINQGSSGGALVNLDGEVVGICIAIASEVNFGLTPYPGTGFAVPSNRVKSVVDQLIEHGKVVRGYLGVVLGVLPPTEARQRKIEGRETVVVARVFPDTPAAQAGLQPQDVILRYQGEKVADMNDFRSRVAATAPGTKVELTVERGDKEVTITATMGEQPEQVGVARAAPASTLGLQLQTLTADIADEMGYKGLTGALVTDVAPDSPAAKAGLEAGDLILEVAKKPVASAEECVKALSEAEGKLLVRVKKPSGETVYQTITKE